MRTRKDETVEQLGRLAVVDHVHLECSRSTEEKLRWFYGQLLGLKKLPDDNSTGAAVLRYRSERHELRIKLDDTPIIDSVDVRLTCEVPSLEETARQLEERKYSFEWIHGLQFNDQVLMLLDPAGNRIMLRRLWPNRTI